MIISLLSQRKVAQTPCLYIEACMHNHKLVDTTTVPTLHSCEPKVVCELESQPRGSSYTIYALYVMCVGHVLAKTTTALAE